MKSPFLHEWLFSHTERRPEAPAVATPTARLSYGDLTARVRALAGHLAASGVGAGDRVLLALPNVPATVVVGLAVNALGGTTVEVNRDWSAEVLAGIVAASRPRHAFVWGRDARTWGTVRQGHARSSGSGWCTRAHCRRRCWRRSATRRGRCSSRTDASILRWERPPPPPSPRLARRAACPRALHLGQHRTTSRAWCRRSATWTRTRARSCSTSGSAPTIAPC